MTQNERNLHSHIFRAGGSLAEDAPSYVRRRADTELYDALLQGEFCYILTSRQMGKSSLMVRTAARLRQNGVRVAALDVTAVGLNLSAEQWYFGLLDILAEQLGLEDEMEAFWEAHANLGPLRRFMAALQTVALPAQPNSLVIFVDEIDAVRQLPFKADEFFAAIRECYNQRTQNKDLERLTFCLIGVASPSDLIEDTRMTPFNIGKRIDLTDFTEEEVAFFAGALSGQAGGAKSSTTTGNLALIRRVLYWTGGHPYLTQRLCKALAENVSSVETNDVDNLCRTLFLSEQAREQDSNLTFVRERILRSDVDRVELLNLYRDVFKGKRVLDDETDAHTEVLKLSGLVRSRRGELKVRNLIYERVFNKEWGTANMPDAELRRQQAAYQKGVVRTLGLAGLVIASMGFLIYIALKSAKREANQTIAAKISEQEAQKQTRLALKKTTEATRNLNKANQNARIIRERTTSLEEALNIAKSERRNALNAQAQAFWQKTKAQAATGRAAYQRQRAERAKLDAQHNATIANQRANDADRNLYVANMNLLQREWNNSNFNHFLELLAATKAHGRGMFEWDYWNRLSHLNLLTLKGHTGSVLSIAFSPDGKRIVTGSSDKTVRVWDAVTAQELLTLKGHTVAVVAVAFSPDGSRIVTGSSDKTVRVWDAVTAQELLTLKGHTVAVVAVAFSPDGSRIVTGSSDKTVRVWDAVTAQELLTLKEHTDFVTAVAFSPDGSRIVTGDNDAASLRDIATGKVLLTLKEHTGYVAAVAFSPDGSRIVTGSWGKTVRVWDAVTGKILITLKEHTGSIAAVAFSPDGKRIVTSDDDATRVWDAVTAQELLTLKGHADSVASIAFSPDGSRIVTGNFDDTARVWDAVTAQELLTLKGHADSVAAVAFSPDGSRIVTGSFDDTARVWDAVTGKVLLTLQGHTGGVRSVAFSPDGKRIVTGSSGGTAKVWFADSTQLSAVP